MAIASVPNVVVGNRTKASDHNALVTAANALIGSVCPVGGIIAWHKSMTGVPALPGRFLECDGSVISDADSPMDGETLPDLNGDARFLRGAATSGAEVADAFQGHYHAIAIQDTGVVTDVPSGTQVWRPGSGGTRNANVRTLVAQAPTTDGSNGTPRIAAETRPINMAVVWIMRIK